MAYGEKLANKIRTKLAHLPDVKEKKMFGGLAFMVGNKMCVTAGANRIMCRVDPGMHEKLIKRKGCRTVIMGGREYRGFVHIDENSLKTKKEFDFWVGLAIEFNKRANA